MHESNVYNLYKPPRLSIVGLLSGHPSISDSLYQIQFLSDSSFQCLPCEETKYLTQTSLSDVLMSRVSPIWGLSWCKTFTHCPWR